MKFYFLLLIISLVSYSSFAQELFRASENKRRLTDLEDTKRNHLVVLREYQEQVDSEIDRLLTGIELEQKYDSASKQEVKGYDHLLADLLLKRIFVTKLQEQLKPVNLTELTLKDNWPDVFNTDNLNLNFEKEIKKHLGVALERKTFERNFMADIRERIIKGVLASAAFEIIESTANGLAARILIGGLGQAALKATLQTLGSSIAMSAGKGTLYGIFSFPLKGNRLPPEVEWTKSLKEHPELILNPEWMKYSGNTDHPWLTHGYAFLRRTERMEVMLNALLEKEEEEFQAEVLRISRLKDFTFDSQCSETCSEKEISSTYVPQVHLIKDFVPYWALREN